MSTKLFVYGVNRSCPKNLLEDQFSKFGAVSDVYITEKGYAFVTMDNAGEAQAAIDELNGTQLVYLLLEPFSSTLHYLRSNHFALHGITVLIRLVSLKIC